MHSLSPEVFNYANRLLEGLGATARLDSASTDGGHPALTWAFSGLMSLTGSPEGFGQMMPVPIADCADGALLALQALAGRSDIAISRGSHLLAERALLADYHRSGPISAGGSCRLLNVADGRIALNLARDDDWSMLPAWLEHEPVETWVELESAVASRSAATLVERGRLLGLPVADSAWPDNKPSSWFSVEARGSKKRKTENRVPIVLDLSALWAGPLCTSLLQNLGARVIKVESLHRPDGAREGEARFFDLMNGGKHSVALDLNSPDGRRKLGKLIQIADIVVESSRPRGLRQMGILAEEIIAAKPGLIWIGITGYGRDAEQGEWVGFGDDAAVAGGLSAILHQVTGQSMFCGDAIADPLTGLHAALLAWHGWKQGEGCLYSVALADVARHCARFDLPESDLELFERQKSWTEMVSLIEAAPPQTREVMQTAQALGADTKAILAEFNL